MLAPCSSEMANEPDWDWDCCTASFDGDEGGDVDDETTAAAGANADDADDKGGAVVPPPFVAAVAAAAAAASLPLLLLLGPAIVSHSKTLKSEGQGVFASLSCSKKKEY